ncbi:polyprenyl synthetase family protein [Kitasatospora purpeofusca]|uniref:polyprenyl synthetase family protein n=1 Tax=Kitasatospora purpeofusca TaxID=67352 RepID=UPI0035DBD532
MAGEVSADRLLRAAAETCEGRLRSWVDRLGGSAGQVAAYQFGWSGEDPGQGGKFVRAALTLACAGAVGGDRRRAVPAAAAVEVVHNLSLLYDDVLDGDTLRRHREAAWRVFGPSAAARSADGLLLTVLDVLVNGDKDGDEDGGKDGDEDGGKDGDEDGGKDGVGREASAALLATLVDLAVGESLDLVFERRDRVGPDECLEMVAAKTASLFSCACRLGALYGGAGPEAVAGWAAFGHDLGMAFQLVDDLLGIWGDPAVTGKPVFNDLRRRKLSVPVVAALDSGTADGDRLAEEYRRTAAGGAVDPAGLALLVERAGGRRWTEARAAGHAAAARDRLGALTGDPAAAAELTALAGLITDREH